jgi:hypothetical protein
LGICDAKSMIGFAPEASAATLATGDVGALTRNFPPTPGVIELAQPSIAPAALGFGGARPAQLHGVPEPSPKQKYTDGSNGPAGQSARSK